MKTYINGNCIEQILTNAVELTQAEYNALPTEQKNHGTYIITDADSPNIPATDVEYSTGVTVKDKIDELSSPTIESGNATFNCDVGENNYCKYIKRGKLVYVIYNFTITSDVSSTQVIINGLPKAVLIANEFNFLAITNDVDGTTRRSLLENSNNNLTIRNYYGRVLVKDGVYVGSFCYIAE